jgi:hypothetical protein
MARKTSAIVQYKLRIRETLRRRIEQAAKARGVSANYEMMSRLERSFDQDSVRTIDIVASDIEANWARSFGGGFHELNKQGDLMRAAEALVALVKQMPAPPDDMKKAAAKVEQVTTAIDLEAARTMRRMHTAGGDQ